MGQDVSNFDTVFTEEDPIDSFVEDSNLSKTVQDQFSGTTHDIWATRTIDDFFLQAFPTTALICQADLSLRIRTIAVTCYLYCTYLLDHTNQCIKFHVHFT